MINRITVCVFMITLTFVIRLIDLALAVLLVVPLVALVPLCVFLCLTFITRLAWVLRGIVHALGILREVLRRRSVWRIRRLISGSWDLWRTRIQNRSGKLLAANIVLCVLRVSRKRRRTGGKKCVLYTNVTLDLKGALPVSQTW